MRIVWLPESSPAFALCRCWLLLLLLACGNVAQATDTPLPVAEHREQTALEAALFRYRQIEAAGGWQPIEAGPTLETGSEGFRVQALLRRLQVSGDLTMVPETSEPPVYDEVLAEAVRRFQTRHGLQADGKAGPRTLRALNEPVAAKIARMEANLQRWRAQPADLGNPHIRINAASYQLEVLQDGQPLLQMRVIVGMPDRRTPVTSSRITHLVVHPYWYVTRNIAVKDKLPLIQKNPDYLEDNGFTVLTGEGASARIVDADDIDWQALSADNFPYLLRQEPGPKNALGRVKFMFPNRFHVYLHDTPARELFASTQRTFSSGCIRLEKPLELADFLLGRDPAWQGVNIRDLIESGEQQTLDLSLPVPVHLQYWTAWVDNEGIVQFREDIYNRDSDGASVLRPEPVN